MSTSQNGWPAYNDTKKFVRGTAAGFGFWAANDDVRVIFEDLVGWFNRVVEPLAGKVLDDWSWANRNVRGSDTQVSNHASATAIDLNALKHPRGVKNTYTKTQRAAIDRQLAYYEGTVRAGKDYVNSPEDDMHFEINSGKIAVKHVADKIRAKLKAQEALMAKLDKDDIKAIAEAVWTIDIVPNENAPEGSKNPTWTPRSMISDIENTQDSHTEILNQILAKLSGSK
jgi:hypothetical protein